MSVCRNGAEEAGYQVSQIVIRDLAFEPDLKFGYKERLELEPDMLAAIDAIKACDHMVWVHSVWWGGLPVLLMSFIDRTFFTSIMFDCD